MLIMIHNIITRRYYWSFSSEIDIYEKLFYSMITNNMWNVHYVYLIII